MNNVNDSMEIVRRINAFLMAMPHLEFTDTGLTNIAKRFGVTSAFLIHQITMFKKGFGNGK